MTALTGVSVLGAATAAYAAGPAAGSNLTATGQPVILPTGPNQAAGGWTLTLAAGTTWAQNDTVTVTVKDAANSAATVAFANVPTLTPSTAACTNCNPMGATAGIAGDVLTITFTGSSQSTATNGPETIAISNVNYNTTAAANGAVNVTVAETGVLNTGAGITAGAAASNAIVSGFAAANFALSASSTPVIGAGGNNQMAGSWTIGLAGQGSGWTAGDKLVIPVFDPTHANCYVSGGVLASVGFGSVPTVTINTTSGQVSAAPTVTASVAPDGVSCGAGSGVNNALTLTFTNSGTVTGANGLGATQPITVSIGGVTYNVSTAAGTGNLWVGPVTYNGATEQAASNAGTPGPSNATVQPVLVSANNPPVSIAPGTTNAPISNIVLTEAHAAGVPAGNVCVTLSDGGNNKFDPSVTPTITETGGGSGTVNSTVTGKGTSTLTFTVLTPSTTAATFTLSNLAIDNTSVNGEPVTLTVQDNGCGTTVTSVLAPPRAYTVLSNSRIFGQDADATAVAEWESQQACGGGNNSAVLATDAAPWDAQSASYLAGHLVTGVLLTPTAGLSQQTINGLNQMAVSTVFVVGGPLAVSQNVINQLKAMQVVNCAGIPQVNGLGQPQMMQVVWIYGQTMFDTASAVAQYFGTGAVGNSTFPGAYSGMYNTTTGSASTSGPTVAVPTAIVVTGNSWQDGVGSGATAWAQKYPVVITDPNNLSSQAQTALTNLGIKQVIVMGGPLAISNNVVTQLQGLGMAVLRIAGQDYTDTSQLLAQFELNNTNLAGVTDGLNWKRGGPAFNTLYVARGDFFMDGLAGAIVGGNQAQPIVFTFDPNTVGQYLTKFLNSVGAPSSPTPVFNVIGLGGPLAITPTTMTTILNDISQG